VRTCPKFKCKAEDAVFVIRNIISVSADDKKEWDGYTFSLDDENEKRPSHKREDNHLHAPMMANTHCIEKNEQFNLSLFHDDNLVIFEASRSIGGGEMLFVDYGDEYNKDLQSEREAARKRAAENIARRAHFSHNYTCHFCGKSCQAKFRLRHQNSCEKRKSQCGNVSSHQEQT